MEKVKKASRGRPAISQIRENIVDILFYKGPCYGYEIYTTYIKIFPGVTMRSVYYHLKKGTQLGEFRVAKIRKEKGDYSWGKEAEKTYYELGKNARPKLSRRCARFFEKS